MGHGPCKGAAIYRRVPGVAIGVVGKDQCTGAILNASRLGYHATGADQGVDDGSGRSAVDIVIGVDGLAEVEKRAICSQRSAARQVVNDTLIRLADEGKIAIKYQ